MEKYVDEGNNGRRYRDWDKQISDVIISPGEW